LIFLETGVFAASLKKNLSASVGSLIQNHDVLSITDTSVLQDTVVSVEVVFEPGVFWVPKVPEQN